MEVDLQVGELCSSASGRYPTKGIIREPLFMTAQDSTIAGTNVRFQDGAQDIVEVEYLRQLMARPRAQHQRSRTDDLRQVAAGAGVHWRVEGQRIHPDTIARATEPVLLHRCQKTPRGAVFVTPFVDGIQSDPLVGYSAYL